MYRQIFFRHERTQVDNGAARTAPLKIDRPDIVQRNIKEQRMRSRFVSRKHNPVLGLTKM